MYEPKEVCTDRVTYKETVKLEMKPTTESRQREIKKTVMVPITEKVKQLKTVQKPVKKMLERQRIDYKIETKVWYDEVSEKVKVPVPVPDCPCFKTDCGCQG